MASVTIKPNQKFPVGTVVGAYSPSTNRHFEGKPSGTAVESATVAADGTLTFPSLPDGNYILNGEVSGKPANLGLGHVPYVEPGFLKVRIAALRESLGI